MRTQAADWALSAVSVCVQGITETAGICVCRCVQPVWPYQEHGTRAPVRWRHMRKVPAATRPAEVTHLLKVRWGEETKEPRRRFFTEYISPSFDFFYSVTAGSVETGLTTHGDRSLRGLGPFNGRFPGEFSWNLTAHTASVHSLKNGS